MISLFFADNNQIKKIDSEKFFLHSYLHRFHQSFSATFDSFNFKISRAQILIGLDLTDAKLSTAENSNDAENFASFKGKIGIIECF